MKFGKQLDFLTLPKYRGYYIQYKELKKAVKVLTGKEKNQASVQEVTHWTSSFLRCGPNPEVLPEARLQEVLAYELDRVSRFANLEEDAIRSQLERLEANCHKDSAAGEVMELIAQRDELGEHIVQLKSFSQTNFTGFRKITKKFDKWSESVVSPWFMAQVVRAGFVTVDFDGMLEVFNRVSMTLLRMIVEPVALDPPVADDATGGSVLRSNEVILLVSHKDSVRVRMELSKRMHLLSDAGAYGKPLQGSGASMSLQQKASNRVFSVFFDRPDNLEVYRKCASTSAEASPNGKASSSASWHLHHKGGHVRDGNANVCVVYEGPGDCLRTEVTLPALAVPRLIAGESVEASVVSATVQKDGQATAAPAKAASEALAGIRKLLRGPQNQNKVRPVANASYVRRMFREESTGIVATFDTDVRIAQVTEWDDEGRSSEYFAYDLLYISTPPALLNSKTPSWLTGILDTVHPVRVPQFTKAAHALARYYAIPQGYAEPHWYRTIMDECDQSNDLSETHSVADHGEGSEAKSSPPSIHLPSRTGSRDLPKGPAEDESVRNPGADVNSLSAPLLGGPSQPTGGQRKVAVRHGATGAIKVRFGNLFTLGGLREKDEEDDKDKSQAALPARKAIVSVQPKTLYSNERTFLEWIHFATIFAAFGVAMLHNPLSGCSANQSAPHCTSDVIVGRFLVVVAIFLVGWSLHTFNWRADALDRKEIRDYHDPVGPFVFIMGLIVALAYSSLRAAGVLEEATLLSP